MLVTGLFIISTSSWFSLGRFYFSKNLFTSSKLSVLLAHTARRSNQSILKEISPEYSLERMTDGEAETLRLRSPDVKSQLFGKDPDAEKD